MEAYNKWIKIMKEFREFMKNHPKLNKIESEDPLLYTDDIFDGIICRLEDIIRGDGMRTLSNKERIQILNEMSSYGTCNISIDEDYKKKYEEAIKKIRELSVRWNIDSLTEELEEIFPEAKEHPEEWIRKEIIKIISSQPFSFTRAMMLGWLERHKD